MSKMFGLSLLRRVPQFIRSYSSVSGNVQAVKTPEQSGMLITAFEGWQSNPAYRNCSSAAVHKNKYNFGNLLATTAAVSSNSHVLHKEYILPNNITSRHAKITIIDPMRPKEYHLPVGNSIVSEVVTPSFEHVAPISDPCPHPAAEKLAAWLVKQRHRKMKKHQLKKLRKRMRFVYRARKLLVKKRKEMALQTTVKKIQAIGDNFDPEVWVKEKLDLARRGGYKMDIFKSTNN